MKRRFQKTKRKCFDRGHIKRIYQTKWEAEKIAQKVLGPHNRSADALRVYHCDRCKGWHLTKQV